MDDQEHVDDDTWLEFLAPPAQPLYCGLCGNSGVVDTRGHVRSPRGQECGVRAFCICPNGRAAKAQRGGTLPPSTGEG